MQDLLNEEEFLQVKKYNPWKKFRRSYLIAFFQACFIYSCTIFGKSENGLIIISILIYFICPITVPFFIVFRKNFYANTTVGAIASGLLILNILYILFFSVIMILDGYYIFPNITNINSFLIGFVFIFLCIYIISTSIILIIRYLILKKVEKQHQKALEAHKRDFFNVD